MLVICIFYIYFLNKCIYFKYTFIILIYEQRSEDDFLSTVQEFLKKWKKNTKFSSYMTTTYLGSKKHTPRFFLFLLILYNNK